MSHRGSGRHRSVSREGFGEGGGGRGWVGGWNADYRRFVIILIFSPPVLFANDGTNASASHAGRDRAEVRVRPPSTAAFASATRFAFRLSPFGSRRRDPRHPPGQSPFTAEKRFFSFFFGTASSSFHDLHLPTLVPTATLPTNFRTTWQKRGMVWRKKKGT